MNSHGLFNTMKKQRRGDSTNTTCCVTVWDPWQGVQRRMVYVVDYFVCFICFSFVVVVIFDLVHEVEAIHGLCWLLNASGNIV